jgi:uncharacterized protein (TIGR03083 family)
MPTTVDRATVVGALHDVWDHLLDLGSELSESEWDRSTRCPGWTVKDLYAHVLGTESMLLGRQAPEVEVGEVAHVRNDIGRINEAWVAAWRARPPAHLLDELRSAIDDRRAALSAMADEAWDEVGFTPAGQDTHGRFMRIRVFDQWIHEQDARTALARPGHLRGPAVEVTLDELGASLGYVVGKRAGAPDGSAVRVEVTGPTERTFDVVVDGRAALVEELDRDPDVTLRVPLPVLIALAGGREGADPADPTIAVIGDEALGRRVLEHLGYTV